MSGKVLPDIRSCNPADVITLLNKEGEPPFRYRQIHEWLWKQGSHSFGSMTNLPRSTRTLLEDNFVLNPAVAETVLTSKDGTRKIGFRLYDGHLVEGVLIPAEDRITACISSQAGCQLACGFCATGRMGFLRNLTAGEIFDQVFHIQCMSVETTGKKLSNIVYMGMGEPLMNYEQVIMSVQRIMDPGGMGISPQRITISTVGIPKMIRKMAKDQCKAQLAVSLHAATDEKRDQIIPLNRSQPLKMLSEALQYYSRLTGKRFTVEYILFGGFNDSRQDALALAGFCKSFPVKINLIEYNPVMGSPYRKPGASQVKAFAGFLEEKNLVVNIRKSRGRDILAACGQLAGTEISEKNLIN